MIPYFIAALVGIFIMTHAPKVPKPQDWKQIALECARDQTDTYGDICNESSTGFEDMDGGSAHFEGVKCASEAVQACIESQ